MKKLLILSSLLSFLVSANAVAKTEGNYVSLSLIDTMRSSKYKYSDSKISLGADYKYAFNFGNLFLAPGVFYDHNNNLSGVQNPNIRYSYGVKLDLGYDVTEKFAPFLTIGESQTHISRAGAKNAMILGAGFRYAFSKDWGLIAAYEMAQFNLGSHLGQVVDGTKNINADYDLIRVGATYHF